MISTSYSHTSETGEILVTRRPLSVLVVPVVTSVVNLLFTELVVLVDGFTVVVVLVVDRPNLPIIEYWAWYSYIAMYS